MRSFHCLTILLVWVLTWGTALAEKDSETETCLGNLYEISEALDAYARDHGNEYPNSLQFLVPDYLPEIKNCPRVADIQPDYQVTIDRRYFGLSCEVDHRVSGPRLPIVHSLVGGIDYNGPPKGQWNHATCGRVLKDRGKKVKSALFSSSEWPRELAPPIEPADCAPYHVLTTKDQEFEIVCTSSNHDFMRIRPLSPRYYSNRSVVDHELVEFIRIPEDDGSYVVLVVFVGGLVLLFCLTVYRTQRSKARETPAKKSTSL